MGQEIFPVMRGGAGMGPEKSMRGGGGGEDPILRPRPAPLPSLLIRTPLQGYGRKSFYLGLSHVHPLGEFILGRCVCVCVCERERESLMTFAYF